jgi:hypothetical protein
MPHPNERSLPRPVLLAADLREGQPVTIVSRLYSFIYKGKPFLLSSVSGDCFTFINLLRCIFSNIKLVKKPITT